MSTRRASWLLRLLLEIDGEELAVVLVVDGGKVSSMPAAAYQGITGVRGREELDEEAEDALLREKLPFFLYMAVLRLRMRGMVCMGLVKK